jgi:hypothetical protein
MQEMEEKMPCSDYDLQGLETAGDLQRLEQEMACKG